jgi:hypothetical protein
VLDFYWAEPAKNLPACGPAPTVRISTSSTLSYAKLASNLTPNLRGSRDIARVEKPSHHEFTKAKRVRTAAEAISFIDSVGFCMLFPVKNVQLPSLYYAMARRQPITWDKYSQKLWKWKNELPKKRRAFYAKYFKGRGTFLSLNLLPHLLAMHGTAVDPEQAEAIYAAGRISHDAFLIWKALAEHGPLATLELRHACKMGTQAGNKRFKKAILELQGLLIVTHSGAEQETDAWASNRFDLVSRAFPQQFRAAAGISPDDARKVLATKYRTLHSGAPPILVARLFGWTKAQAVSALALLYSSRIPKL